MRVTQHKGDIGLTKAIARFTELGFDVSIPVTESAPYDLIVDTSEGLRRVQCKYTSRPQLDLRHVHSNAGGYVVSKTASDAYDWLYIYSSDGKEYLIKECLHGRATVNVNSKYEL